MDNKRLSSGSHRGSKSEKNKSRDLPTRGYYAELLTDLNYTDEVRQKYTGAHKKTKNLWQIKTDKHAPIIRQMEPPRKKPYLAPAERWMTFEEDKHISFPVDTFKPKVQLQHEVEPKTLPRNVAIERRRREYQAQRLKSKLAALGIQVRDLLPIEVLRKYTSKAELTGLHCWTSFLPLELFDDEDYDISLLFCWDTQKQSVYNKNYVYCIDMDHLKENINSACDRIDDGTLQKVTERKVRDVKNVKQKN